MTIPLPEIDTSRAPTLADIAAYLAGELQADQYPGEEGGIVVPTERPVRRFGLALQPSPGLMRWAAEERCDALFLHRHWHLDPGALAPGVGVVAYHKPYDAQLTTGPNAPLAREMGFRGVESVGEKNGAPAGMLGRIEPVAFADFAERVATVFGDLEGVAAPAAGDETLIDAAVVMSAMDEPLIALAAARGAGAYVTGQYRVSAAEAVRRTGIGVIAIGHERGERWGLHVLARLLALAFPAVEPVVAPSEARLRAG